VKGSPAPETIVYGFALLTYHMVKQGDAVDQIKYYLHEILAFLQNGLHEGFGHVNNTALGIIIALYSAYRLHEFKKIWQQALAATILHRVAEILIPVLANEGRFQLPPNMIELSYWEATAVLYLGYLVVIAVLFFIKTRVLSGGGGGGH
jgi:hypothetical protein